MKKLLCIVLSALFVFGMMPISAFAYEEPETAEHEVIVTDIPANTSVLEQTTNTSGYYTYTVSNGEAAITDCNESISGAVTIPSTLGDYPVTSIGEYAFYNCKGLTSITIGNGVTSIGGYAFSGCTGLTSVTIPDSVTSIGSDAFRGCTGLTSMFVNTGNTVYHSSGNCIIETNTKELIIGCNTSVIPADGSVTSIGENAFSRCTGLTYITIPDSVTSIGSSAFRGCTGLTSITIGNSVTSIGDYAFYNCTGLTQINYNAESVSDLTSSSNVFYNAGTSTTGINVIFGDSVKTIPAYLFFVEDDYSLYRPKITSATIGNNVTSIGGYAFYYCTGLTSITIPDSVTSIGERAFNNCTGLTSVTIPDSVTNIGNGAFYGCTRLTSITIPDSVTSIVDYVFYNCTGLTSITIGNGVTSIGGYAFSGCTGLTSVTIPDSVTSIGYSAFYNCTGLTSLTIGNGVTSIGNSAFCNLTGLTVIYYNIESISDFSNHSNVFYNAGTSTTGINVIFGDSVKTIPAYLFFVEDDYSLYRPKITSATIGNNVTSIGGYAFYYCTGLTSITIPDSVTSIGYSAFYNTAWYNNQPNGLVYAGKVAYEYKGAMPSNTSVTLKEDTKGIAGFAFFESYGLKTITIPESVTNIGIEAFVFCNNLDHVFYFGTQEQWNSIQIDDSNSELTNAVRHYECTEKSFVSGSVHPSCSVQGGDYFHCNICGKTYNFNVKEPTGIHTYTDEGKCSGCDRYIESAHNYADFEDKSWTVKRDGASRVTVTFSENTYIDFNRDFIYIYDKNGVQVGKYTGTSLANKSVSVDGDTTVIRLVSDAFGNFYGFALTDIVFDMGDSFADLPENAWFTDSCMWCSENGYMLGTDSTTFAPNATLTRAMLVMILARIDGVNLDAITYSGKFADVKASDWFAKAVQWAIDNGITNGMSEVAFAPNGAVTREQVAKFFMSYAKYKGYSTTKSTSLGNFTDFNKVSSWALSAVKWAVAEGLISGTTETTLSPKSSATRAQAAVIFKRFVENYVAKQK